MATKTVQNQRRATASQLALANPVLDAGEFVFETDTRRYKVGDGATPWSDLVVPYLPSGLIQAKGDMVGYGVRTVERMGNNNFLTDSNNDGIVDGWTRVLGSPSQFSTSPAGQTLTSSAGMGTSMRYLIPVIAGRKYKFELHYLLNSLGTSAYQDELQWTLYSDNSLATVLNSSELDTYTSGAQTLHVDRSYTIGTFGNTGFTLDQTGVLAITVTVYGGASATYTSASFQEIKNGNIRIPAGTVAGSRLTIDNNSLINWTTTDEAALLAPYIKASDMASTYRTQSDAASVHSQFETAAAAADPTNGYETINNAAIAHALHEYSVNAANDYHTPASLVSASYEPIDQFVVLGADFTQTNSATQVNPSGFSVHLDANGIYIFEVFLVVTGTVANGMRVGWTINSPLSLVNTTWGVHAPVPGAGTTTGNIHQSVATGSGTSAGTQQIGLGGSTPLFAIVRGTFSNGANAGYASFTFAQNTAAASTSCTLGKDSYIRLVKAA